jgi:hypothetical protein
MFSLPTFKLPSFLSSDSQSYASIDIPSVQIHDVETSADKRPRTLKHLLKANHANHSIVYHGLMFHNHASHVCRFYASKAVAAKFATRSWDQHTFWVERRNT